MMTIGLTAKEELVAKLEYIVYLLDTEKLLSARRQEWIAESLADFTISAITKFIEGQREHGDTFDEIHGPTEAMKEVIDLFFYLKQATHPL